MMGTNTTRPAKRVPGTSRIDISRYDKVFPEDVKIGDWLVNALTMTEFQVRSIVETPDAFVFNGVKRQKGFRQLVAF